MNSDNKQEMQKRVAWLESRLDLAESELSHINDLLKSCGFPEGIRTLKATIEELLEEADYPRFRAPPSDDYPPQTMDPFAQ